MSKVNLLVPAVLCLAIFMFWPRGIQAPAPIPLCHSGADEQTPRPGVWVRLELNAEAVANHMANHPHDYVIDESGHLTPGEPYDDTCGPTVARPGFQGCWAMASEISEARYRALCIIEEHNIHVPSEFAELAWPDSPYMKKACKCGRGSVRGAALNRSAGALLARLKRAGLIQWNQVYEQWELAEGGRAALAEYRARIHAILQPVALTAGPVVSANVSASGLS